MNFNFLEEGVFIYTLLFFLLVFVTLSTQERNNNQNKGAFIVFVLLYIFLGGLRGSHVGSDTFGYILHIESFRQMTYSDILLMFESDKVGWLFFKLVSSPFHTYTPYFLILQVLFWIPVSMIIHKYSKNSLFALLLFVSFRFAYFPMTGMRQGVALALVFLSLKYLLDNKNIKFVMLVILASSFHKSAIVFLLALVLRHIKLQYNVKSIVAVLFACVFVFIIPINSLSGVTESEFAYSAYLQQQNEKTSNIFLLIMNILSFVYLNLVDKSFTQDRLNNILFNLSFVSMIFSLFTFVHPIFARVGMYFGFFVPLAIANTIPLYNGQNTRKVFVTISVGVLIVIYVITGIPVGFEPYTFFWE